MPIVAVAPPQPVPVSGGFDYVTVDAQRRRVYAAHGGARTLLVVDADTGKVVANVRVGGAPHGVAVEPIGGHVFVGDADGKVSDVDPVGGKVVRSLDVGGPVDAMVYDSARGRIYADEDDGTKLWVIDATTFKLVGTVALPGHKPEYLAVDPVTHDVYQNIDDTAEVVVIDTSNLSVRQRIKTPELTHNHPLQYDDTYGQIVTAGANGVMSVYDRAGIKLGQVDVPKGIDQCDLDRTSHRMSCAHGGSLTLLELQRGGAPRVLASVTVAPGVHTTAIDPKTKTLWAVWGRRDGGESFVQAFRYYPTGSPTPDRTAASPTASPPR